MYPGGRYLEILEGGSVISWMPDVALLLMNILWWLISSRIGEIM